MTTRALPAGIAGGRPEQSGTGGARQAQTGYLLVIYLHLSRRHLQAIPNPLDTMNVSTAETVRRSRRELKR